MNPWLLSVYNVNAMQLPMQLQLKLAELDAFQESRKPLLLHRYAKSSS